MLQTAEPRVKVDNDRSKVLECHCKELFNEWLLDLTADEQEIWFWNASVEIFRIKRRRAVQVN